MSNEIDWEEHGSNAWLSIQRAQLRARDDSFTPTKADKGHQINDLLTGLGSEVFNPETLSYRTFERMAFHDSTVWAAYQRIRDAVVSRGWRLSGGDTPEQREFIRCMLEEIDITAVLRQIMTAFIFGHSLSEKVFDTVEFNGRTLWTIKKIKTLPVETVRYDSNGKGDIPRFRQISSVPSRGFGPSLRILGRGAGGLLGGSSLPDSPAPFTKGDVTFKPWKVIHYVHNPVFGNPYGLSGLKPVYKAWFLKDHMLRYWARHLELAGGALFVAKSGHMKPRVVREEIDKMKSSSTIALLDDQELKVIFPPSGMSGFHEQVSYYDGKIAQAMGVPSLLLGESTEFGSRALSETHFALFKLSTVNPEQKGLRDLVDALIKQVMDLNFRDVKNPIRFSFLAWSNMELEQRANVWQKLAKIFIIGENDRDMVREDMEMEPVGPDGVGDPLVKIDNIATPGTGGGGLEDDDIDSPSREGNEVGNAPGV